MNPDNNQENQAPTKVEPELTPPTVLPSTTNPDLANIPPEKPKKSRKFLIILLTVVGLAALLGGGLLALQNQDPKVVQQSTEVVKKDIPLIRFSSYFTGWEAFYPNIDNSSNYADTNTQVFEGLVRIYSNNKIQPVLATGWSNPDDETWVFELKKGVKFHTGREMIAEDVVASFNAAKDTLAGKDFFPGYLSIEATGPYQVTIKTDGPDPVLLNKLAPYFVYDTKSGKDADAINGTGPYTLKSGTTPTFDSLELVAFDDYHGGRPNVRAVSLSSLGEADATKAFDRGETDLTVLKSNLKPELSRPSNSYLIETTGVFTIFLNAKRVNSPLNKLEVRQAINYAVDPSMLAGVRSDEPVPASQIIARSIPGYDPTIERVERDTAKAKTLLTKAGYPNGVSITLTYFAPAKTTAEEIKRQLAEAGITVVLDPQTEVSILANKARNGGTDAYFQTVSSDILDASDVIKNAADNANFTDEKALNFLKQAQATLNAQKRLTFLKQASRALVDSQAVVPVYADTSSGRVVYDGNYEVKQSFKNFSLNVLFFEVYAK